ncbi:MAG: hypothetical protein AAFR46_07765 [Pseudomonadota bacterium]
MTRFAYAALFAAVLATPGLAQDFAEGSNANSWGLFGEEKARFTAQVVDVICELSGDCPADCGGGDRQLALLRDADQALVLPLKNGQPVFSGAAADLLPYCNKAVEVDGLLVGDPDDTPVKFYQVQLIRETGAEEWAKANLFTRAWAEEFPDAAAEKGPWFRKDPRVSALIGERGYLGLGLEVDEAFIEDWFAE